MSGEWCSGFFDGEGNIHLSTQLALSITVVNTQKELLEPFLRYGGSINVRKGTGKPTYHTVYQWRIGGNNIIRNFIGDILPHILSKRNQELFRLALEFLDYDYKQKGKTVMNRDSGQYERYYQQFKELHR